MIDNNTYFTWQTHKSSEGVFQAKIIINRAHSEALLNGRYVESATFWEAEGYPTRARAKAAATKALRWAKGKLAKADKYGPIFPWDQIN